MPIRASRVILVLYGEWRVLVSLDMRWERYSQDTGTSIRANLDIRAWYGSKRKSFNWIGIKSIGWCSPRKYQRGQGQDCL